MIEGMEIIGENLNATRKLLKTSKRLVEKDGGVFLKYADTEGREAFMDLTAAKAAADEKNARLLPYIAEGVKQRDARWAQATAASQIAAGADFIDLCVDECTTKPDERWEHMKWLIETVAPVVGETRLALDSSDSDLLRQGLEMLTGMGKKAMINSINLEPARKGLIPDIAKHAAKVVAGASGEKGLPKDADERVANMDELQALMDEAGIAQGDRYFDPLVLPIATDPQNGLHLLNAAKAVREKYPEVHITGGVSNVSFGLPNRSILNNAMMCLLKRYGGDSAIVNPLEISEFKEDDPAFPYAVNALEGRDMYCAEYTAFVRGS